MYYEKTKAQRDYDRAQQQFLDAKMEEIRLIRGL